VNRVLHGVGYRVSKCDGKRVQFVTPRRCITLHP